MSSRNDIAKHVEKQKIDSTLSEIMQKMSDTLTALGQAFDSAAEMQDPMDNTQNEVGKATGAGSKRRQMIDL